MTAATKKINNNNNDKQYLNRLLNKHQKTSTLTQSFVKGVQKNYERDIKSGKYQIKQGKFSKADKNYTLSRADIHNLKNVKESLEKNLDQIDSRVRELTEPQILKKSKAIDQNQRRKFVSQMAKVRRSAEKRRLKKIKQLQQQQKEISLKLAEEVKVKEEQIKNKRKQEILKRTESLELAKKNRKTEYELQNKILKEKMNEKILSQRMLEKYQDNQSTVLIEKKKKLAQIRSLHKPLSKEDFSAHLQKINELQTSRPKYKPATSRYNEADIQKFYKSSWYKKAMDDPIQFEDQKNLDELEHVKQMKDKLKKYAEYVRHNFKPEINKRKSLTSKNKSTPIPVPTQDLRDIGLKYLQYSKSHIDESKRSKNNEQSYENQKRKNINKPINYLEDLRRNNPNQHSKTARQYVESIKNKKNLSQGEKAHKILDYIQAIQRKAKMREQKGKLHKEVDEQLDDLYMEAIAVKLSLLGKQ